MSYINAGLNVLVYHSLPTGAFDQNGNVSLPGDFAVPQGWTETVGRVTQSPDFGALLKILGTLTVPNTDWHCYRVALNFRDGTLKVILMRSTTEVRSDERIASNWAANLWNTPVMGLKAYAGRRKVLPPVLLENLKRVVSTVTDSGYWSREIADEAKRKARDYKKWQVTSALGLVTAFLEFLGSLTSSSKVLVTVLWFDPARPSVPGPKVFWAPVHQLWDAPNVRVIHYWWNSGWDSVPKTYPFIYSGTLKRRGWGVTDVAHHPWDLARAFYPNGNWPDLDVKTVQSASKPQIQCRRVRDYDGTWDTVCEEVPQTLLDNAVSDVGDAQNEALELPQVFDPFLTTASELGQEHTPAAVGAADAEIDHSPSAPLIYAHLPLEQGGAAIGPGSVRDGAWFPDDAIEPQVPPMIWLPALGVVAEFNPTGDGWLPSGFVPAALAHASVNVANAPDAPHERTEMTISKDSDDIVSALSSRQQIVKWAQWGVQNEPKINYQQLRPVDGLNKPGKLPLTTDCSGFVTLCYKWGGAPDPNGGGYSGTMYTGTLLRHCRSIAESQLLPGDLVIFGPGTGDHVVVMVGSGANGLVVSHGSQSGPKRYSLQAAKGYHRGPVRPLRCPGLGAFALGGDDPDVGLAAAIDIEVSDDPMTGNPPVGDPE